MGNKFQETVHDMTKKMVIFAASLIYLNYTIDYSLKTVKLKIFSKKLRDLPYRMFFNLFVLTVNLNLYSSSEAFEVRANRLYCVCLTSHKL